MILNPSWKDFELLNELLEKKNKENEKLKKALEISKDALKYIEWPRYDLDHWDRVNRAKETLSKIQELEK